MIFINYKLIEIQINNFLWSKETYKRAREKEKLAEKVSDINTTSDEEENKRKRKLRTKKVFTSSESEDDDASVVAKLPRKNKPLPLQLTYPKPPSLKTTSSVMRNNMNYIEESRSDSDIEIEKEIDKYQKSNTHTHNSDPLKNTSENSCEENVTHNKNQEARGKNVFMFGILYNN